LVSQADLYFHLWITYISQSFDVSGLMLALTERHSEMPAASKSAIPVVVPDPDNKPTTYVIVSLYTEI